MSTTDYTKTTKKLYKLKTSNLLSYDASNLEPKWSVFWEDIKLGQPSDAVDKFTMLLPPPNVTGCLHMGHGFQSTLMDVLARYMRMQGRSVRWVVGTDHAGIATQMVVERKLANEGQTRQQLSREEFLQKVWEWRDQSGHVITQQLRRLGVSVDWDNERFTMDSGFNIAVRQAFIKLYRDGLIYRGTRLVHWDTVFQTAISDLEVEHRTIAGHIWHIAYKISGNMSIEIATTRPETMFADRAIAVHPDDERYKHLIGKMAFIPLTNMEIPIIADSAIDMGFGSGAVKITPAHDHNDYAIGLRHNLDMISVINPDATLNDYAPIPLQGLDRFVARKKLIEMLEADGSLVKVMEHTSLLPFGDRSNSIIEPLLTTQWYMKTDKLAKEALSNALDGYMKFMPEYWINTYRYWLDNPLDWCISRQLWWGHRIPAWHDDEGNVYVGESENEVRELNNLGNKILHEDEDVLDTWFSSAIWPLETLGFFTDPKSFKDRYPTDVLVTGFDILFFWVARMSMMGLHFAANVPFSQVLITGLVRDSSGRKMSKSLGNILDPLHLIDGVSLNSLIESRTYGMMQPHKMEQITKATKKEFPDGIEAHGADALRLNFCALHNTGQDVIFDMERLVSFRNFCNKIWNVAKLIEHRSLSCQYIVSGELTIYDAWIENMLNAVITEIKDHILNYRFSKLVQVLQDWFWTFTDWYCEMFKVLMQRNSQAALYNICYYFDKFLRVAHPLIPFITEELSVFTSKLLHIDRLSLALESYPVVSDVVIKTDNVDMICELITHTRNICATLNIKPNEKLDIYLDHDIVIKDFLEQEKDMLLSLGKIKNICYEKPLVRTASKYSAKLGYIRVSIEHLDVEAEILRLKKQLHKLQNEYDKIMNKINQPLYASKAPESIKNADLANKIRQEDEINEYIKLLSELGEKFLS